MSRSPQAQGFAQRAANWIHTRISVQETEVTGIGAEWLPEPQELHAGPELATAPQQLRTLQAFRKKSSIITSLNAKGTKLQIN